MHNIHHELHQTVLLARNDAIGQALRLNWLFAGLIAVSSLLVPASPLSVLWVALVVGAVGWSYLVNALLPAARVTDERLALLAEIGFNERDAGKSLKDLLQLKGFITYSELLNAEKEYNKDNVRIYRLRETGASKFLAEVSEAS
jgi:hypothetical protein